MQRAASAGGSGGFHFGDRQRTTRQSARAIALAVVVLLACASPSAADEVTLQGIVVEGKITKLTGSDITFEPAHTSGDLTIKWDDVQGLKSDGPFEVLYGDNEEIDAPLRSFADGKLIVGPTPESATAIDVSTLFSGFPIAAEGPSFMNRMRSSFRYWSGNLDLGFNLQQATTNTKGFLLSFKTKRTKGPSRFSFGADYRYSTQEAKVAVVPPPPPPEPQKVEKTTVIQDQFFGFVREEYDFFPRVYGFAAGDATYDGIQHLSIRGVPKAGVGFIIWEDKLDETKRNFLQTEVGGGWVYQKYFGGNTNDYATIAFDVLAGYYLPYDSHFDFKYEFLPAVDAFTTDYVMRLETGVTVPIIGPISGKFTVTDAYNSVPDPGTKPNSLFIDFALSLAF